MLRRTIRLAFLTSIALLLQKLECGLGAFYPTMDAEVILQSQGTLWYPSWCSLTQDSQGRVIGTSTSVSDFLSSLVRIFTSFDNQQQLNDNSMLWTMPLQLWGMLYVMMCMPIVINLNAPRRFIFYAIMIVLLGFTYSQYLTFFIGMVVADLRASGLIKKLQHRSRIAFLSVELLLAATFFVFLCYNTIEGSIVRAISPTTFDRGVMGVDTQEDDFARQPMVLFRASLLYIWLEMSVTLQFLVDNFFLRAIGRVGFGFYVSQMSVLYLVIPPMVSKYHESGDLYWNGIICTWLACFTTNYVVAWILTKTVDRMGQIFSTWISKTMAREGFIGLIREGLKNTFNAICYLPRLCTTDFAKSVSSKGSKTRSFCHKVANWRTPVPIVPPPEHPLHYGLNQNELHSTLFDADISNDEQAVRTRKVLRIWSYMAPINALIISGIALTWGLLNPWHGFTTKNVVSFSAIWRAMWLFAVPYCIITFIGFATPDITRTPEQQKKQPVKREFIRNFYILSVTRGSNPEATRRAHSKLKKLEQYHPAVRVCVLTDEPYVYPDLDNIVCPKSYVSPKGLAKHKARALDYFRHTMQLGPYDFVLHMDEESTMDAESLRGCFDFVRYTTHHMGQGIIIYNGHNYWANWKAWLFAVADTIRVGDDLARFSLQTNVIHRPVFGIHGSFLLLNGEAENVVGWDFSSLAEDFEFSQAAWMKGFTLGRIHGVVREQSPEGFQDMLKQRRRWYMGIRQIRGVYYLPQLGIKLWTLGLFCLVATVANLLFSLLIQWSGPSPMWIYTLSVFCFGAFQWLYSGGLLFQEMDYGYKLRDAWQVPLHFLALIVIQPFMAAVEACAVVWAMSTEDGEVGFQVVKK
ncbi:uncharacterized protein FA14DRAFT_161866 [Meira miltonrushii]|uniref:Glycosyltransferase 2-like domain-containing protein n=1 Tax=Meira miltonrushii TaxID=1280837 RepID=A0A316V4N8_9BASI|nr:uncharacterized protein FA14DRAFT_161866 [Meira miltonrushii]PWN32422.1 hypothetical protein FA14DRAFT_161866 [Meira miltonrushii]